MFQVLGPLTATRDGVALPLGGIKPRTVLAMLLLHRGEVVPAARLIDAVWADDPPASARETLQTYVSHLRRTLGPDTIRTAAPGYIAAVPAEAFDAARFERLATRGRDVLAAGEQAEAALTLRAALGQWHGPALADLADLPFASGHVARLERARTAVLLDRIDIDLSLGGHAAVAAELEGLVAADPLVEPLWVRLMQALYGAGHQTDALATYQRARDALRDTAGLEPGPGLRAAERAVLTQDASFAPAAAAAAGASMPAPVDSFVGRDGDVACVSDLLARHRLVTIVGPGGCGKTRLALQSAQPLPEAGGRTWLVELGGLRDEALVADTVAGAVRPPQPRMAAGGPVAAERSPVEVAAAVLSGAPALLLIDNCEHVLDGVADVIAALLARCPRLRVLATSREPLALAGEAVHGLRPLPISSAKELFIDRAIAARPGIAARLRGADARQVAELCRRLDGLPLAIELAAARTRLLDVSEILARLEDRFVLLGGGRRGVPDRHRTLRAAVAWSEELLQPAERRSFARLAVFPDSFSLPAAEATISGIDLPASEVLGVLGRLVDTSLVQRVDLARDGTRFKLLETVRAYAAEQLRALGEYEDAGAAHASFVLAQAAALRTGSRGPDQANIQHGFHTDLHDHRQALAHLVDHGDLQGAWQLASGLWYLWVRFGHVEEARRWFTRTAAIADGEGADVTGADVCTRARLRAGAAFFAWAGRHPDAAAHARVGLALAAEAADPDSAGTCQVVLAMEALAQGEEGAEGWLRQALAAHAEAGDPGGVAMCHNLLGLVARRQGATDVACRESQAALAVYRELGDVWGIGWALWSLGRAEVALGQLQEAAEHYRSALQAWSGTGHDGGLTLCLRALAEVAWKREDRARAAQLLGAADALAADLGTALEALGGAENDVDLHALRSALDDPALAAATADGAAMGVDDAIVHALADDLAV